MAYTTNLGIAKLIPGTQQAHVIVNEAMDVIDRAVAGLTVVDLTASPTVSLSGGQSTAQILKVVNATADATIKVQNLPKVWVLINDTSHSVTLQIDGQAVPPTPTPAGDVQMMCCDGVTGVRRVT